MSANTLNDVVNTNAKNSQLDPNATTSQVVASGNEYDHVLSFFKKVMKDDVAASKFAESLYQVALATEVPVLLLLDTFKGQDLMSLTATMAYYLNGIRSPATLLGIKNVVKPNYYAARNVLS